MLRFGLALIAAAAWVGSASPAGSVQSPARVAPTPIRAALADWLKAFNAGDAASLEAFRARYRYAEPVEDIQGLRDFTGGFALVRVEQETPAMLVARVRDRDGELRERLATLRIDARGTLAAIEVKRQPLARLTEAEAIAGFAARTAALAGEDRFAGTVLVARHGKVLFERAYGMADRERRVPMTLDTRIRYASMGKMFTAVAALRLVADGKLRLDGTVGDYLPDYPDRTIAGHVTVRQLLTHRGGTGDVDTIDIDWIGDQSRFRTLADYVSAYGARAPAFAPGSKVEYSNYGFILLGRILEAVSGRDYDAVIAETVFRPAGMTRSGYAPEAQAVPGRSVPYTKRGDRWVDIAQRYPYRGLPAGGGYTTVGDLLRFATALQSGRLLPAALAAQATTPQNGEGWYGFGFITGGTGKERRWGHGGDFPGSNAWFFVLPEAGWVTIALSNLDPPAAYTPMRWLEPRLPLE